MKKELKIKRLKQLKKMLENHKEIFPDVDFDMMTYFDKRGDRFTCCTLTCISAYPPFIEQGWRFNPSMALPTYNGVAGLEAAIEFFGVNISAACEFSHPQYGYDTPKDVAKRVGQLIKTLA